MFGEMCLGKKLSFNMDVMNNLKTWKKNLYIFLRSVVYIGSYKRIGIKARSLRKTELPLVTFQKHIGVFIQKKNISV